MPDLASASRPNFKDTSEPAGGNCWGIGGGLLARESSQERSNRCTAKSDHHHRGFTENHARRYGAKGRPTIHLIICRLRRVPDASQAIPPSGCYSRGAETASSDVRAVSLLLSLKRQRLRKPVSSLCIELSWHQGAKSAIPPLR